MDYYVLSQAQSNLAIKKVLIRKKFVLRNQFPWPNGNLLHKDITKFDCTIKRKINSYVFVKVTMSEFRNICEKEFVYWKELDFEFTLTNRSWRWCWILKQFLFLHSAFELQENCRVLIRALSSPDLWWHVQQQLCHARNSAQ